MIHSGRSNGVGVGTNSNFWQIKRISWRRGQSRNCRRKWFGTSVYLYTERVSIYLTFHELRINLWNPIAFMILRTCDLSRYRDFLFPMSVSAIFLFRCQLKNRLKRVLTNVLRAKLRGTSFPGIRKRNYASLIIRCP